MEMYCGWHKYSEVDSKPYYKNDMGVDWYEFEKTYENVIGKFFFLKGRDANRLCGWGTDIKGWLPQDYNNEYVDLYIFEESELPQDFKNAYDNRYTYPIIIEDWNLTGIIEPSLFKYEKYMEYVNSEIVYATGIINSWQLYIDNLIYESKNANKIDPDYNSLPQRPFQ